ncbi:MAG TPA: hypothetical protein VHE57_01370 [Mycobacteriales bacterium]|nr:hypothetical protein [Mycobacteriales bacterium]
MSKQARSDALAELDERALPAVAGALRGVARAARAVVGSDGVVGKRVAPWIRREPVIAIALACVAAAAILIAVTGGDRHRATLPSGHLGPRLSGAQLGPLPGSTVATYESQASGRRASLDQLASSQQLVAVVDLDAYISPQAVDQLLHDTPGLRVVLGFARVPPPQEDDVHVLATSADAGLSTELTLAQQAAGDVALHYERLLSRSITHPTTELAEKVQAGAARAAAARIDASGLGPTCGCVFAFAVEGPVAQLQSLSRQAAVRILDPAPVGAKPDSLVIMPLEPQVTGKVPEVSFARLAASGG